MSTIRILFANIGWMTHYRGYSQKDKIKGGGGHPNEDKHEQYNFYPINGKCYGYVEPPGRTGATLNINRIDNSIIKKETIDNVLVIWVATHPHNGGKYIVGWYKNATVYKDIQKSSLTLRKKYPYNIEADEKDCFLLTPDQRTYLIPRATNEKSKGYLGRSNVWYADSPKDEVQAFRSDVYMFIQSYNKDENHTTRQILKVDAEARKRVEIAAVNYVTRHYEKLGYKVISREKDNIGWDLDVILGKTKLKIEVKGIAQEQVNVRITANEYRSMVDNKDSYRLCVVTNAIENPLLTVFIWNCEQEEWVADDDNAIILKIEEKPTYLATVE